MESRTSRIPGSLGVSFFRGAVSKNLNDIALLDEGLIRPFLMKQVSEVILACSFFFIEDGFERMYFIWVEQRVT